MAYISELLLQKLSSLDCFVRSTDKKAFARLLLSVEEMLLGVYMNTPDDFILFTADSLYVVRNDSVANIPFNSITSVELLENQRIPALLLKLDTGSTFPIEVMNETEGVADVCEFQDLLKAILFFPYTADQVDEVRKIASKSDFADFITLTVLEKEDKDCGLSDISTVVRCGFPDAQLLKMFDIDEDILKRADVWRLMALFVGADFAQISEKLSISSNCEPTSSNTSPNRSIFIAKDGEPLPTSITSTLSAGSRSLLDAARLESLQRGLRMVYPECILIALLAYDADLCRQTMNRSLLNVESVRHAIDRPSGLEIGPSTSDVPFSLGAQTLMADSFYKMERSKSKKILPIHILAAINQSADPTFLRLLQRFDID